MRRHWTMALCGFLAAGTVADVKPVFVIGHRNDAQALMADVLNAGKIVNSRVEWIRAAHYTNAAAVYIGGTVQRIPPENGFADADEVVSLRNYLEGGGTVVLSCLAAHQLLKQGAPGLDELFGFRKTMRFTDVKGVIVKGADGLHPWCTVQDVLVPAELMPGTETLATFVSKDGKTAPAATRRPVGKGQVYWVQTPYVFLKAFFEKRNIPLSEAGAAGESFLTPEGKIVDSLARFYRNLFASANNLEYERQEEGWALVPLGKPGTLKLDPTFREKPTFCPKPVMKDGLKLVGDGVCVTVTAPGSDKVLAALANELAWHLSEMTGETIAARETPPDGDAPSIILGGADAASAFGIDVAALRHEESIIRRRGNKVFVGGEGAGASHAVTYLLEALGCRYLWPGKLGKVIPKKNPLFLPEFELDFTPAMYARGIRATEPLSAEALKGTRTEQGLRHFGIDPAVFCPRYNAACIDRAGNRDFFRWHGVSDNEDYKLAVPGSKSPWKVGHYFRDFWPRYGKTHPEWFALQPNGSRRQNLGSRTERPCFCLSNTELARETARRLAAELDVYPWKTAWTVGLPDGGASQQCMCPACRALDPPNAQPENWTFLNPKTAQREKYPYVAITDRVVTFMNRVIAELRRLRPGKELTFYAYSYYTVPPVAVKPDPGLICLSVSGNYNDLMGRDGARRNIAQWQQLCPRTLWRPNALRGFFTVCMPQDFSRALAGDVEWMKANGLLGTDFDCMDNKWAIKGLTYYLLCRALLNPDHLTPETLIEDYCATGFGKAAPAVREYFRALEGVMDRAAANVSSNKDKFTPDDHQRRLLTAQLALKEFDPVALSAILDRAEALAKDEPDTLARIRFLRVGIEHGRFEKAVCAAEPQGGAEYNRLRTAYYSYIVEQAEKNPLAVPPFDTVRYNPFMMGFKPGREE